MSTMKDTAMLFFDACETGQGWEGCRAYCHSDATFSAQADALAEFNTLAEYTEWMKGLGTPCPDGRYELKGFAADDERSCVLGFGVFMATHTGPGGPVEPTGQSVSADYVYIMAFDGDRIRHMTKVWNDGHSLRQLGWV